MAPFSEARLCVVRMMQKTVEPTGPVSADPVPAKPLTEQVADAVCNTAVPISRLLRLMWALDAEPSPDNENLRAQLRARIGAPVAV